MWDKFGYFLHSGSLISSHLISSHLTGFRDPRESSLRCAGLPTSRDNRHAAKSGGWKGIGLMCSSQNASGFVHLMPSVPRPGMGCHRCIDRCLMLLVSRTVGLKGYSKVITSSKGLTKSLFFKLAIKKQPTAKPIAQLPPSLVTPRVYRRQ
jgi:hypothetical protein